MFHPFKRLEAKWNAHTPVWLHNRTKENIIFQLIATVILMIILFAKDEWEWRRDRKKYANNTNIEDIDN